MGKWGRLVQDQLYCIPSIEKPCNVLSYSIIIASVTPSNGVQQIPRGLSAVEVESLEVLQPPNVEEGRLLELQARLEVQIWMYRFQHSHCVYVNWIATPQSDDVVDSFELENSQWIVQRFQSIFLRAFISKISAIVKGMHGWRSLVNIYCKLCYSSKALQLPTLPLYTRCVKP